MSRSPEARARTGVAAALAGVLTSTVAVLATGTPAAGSTPSPTATASATPSTPSTPAAPASPTAPATIASTQAATATSLDGLSAPVFDIITTVESLDRSQSQEDTATKRTLILDSRVLFAEDRAQVTAAARGRLREAARQIEGAGATGTVQVTGYTDDQGSAASGLVLSRRRAEAVRAVLAPLLRDVDVQLRTRGLGEADPRFPNASPSGTPLPRNQARNRRVEITFARQDG